MSRREAARALIGLAVGSVGTAGIARAAPGGAPTFHATGLNHLALRVRDVGRSRDFYQRHLGASIIRDQAPGNCFLRVGEHYLGLFRAGTPAMDHYCFTVRGFEADGAVAKLEAAGLGSRRQEDRVYFNDPDGLEIQLDSRLGSWPGPPPEDLS